MLLQESKLILIVDDTPTNLAVISEALSEAGFEVAIAPSGDRAFKQLQLQLPDLILLDVMMPVMDGFEVCMKLKANPKTQDIPVIFMTALSDMESKTRGFELGAVDYIVKPFQELEVLARVNTHLQLRSLTKNLEQQVAQRTLELNRVLKDLQASQLQVIQNEKMSALGNLVAGVAHEINNPVGFIYGNLDQARQALEDLIEHLKLYADRASENDINNHAQEIELEYLMKDVPKMIDSMKVGCEQIKNISTSLRTFSRADRKHPVKANLHEGIDSTILILKHRLKASEFRPAIEVVTDCGDIPEIECFLGQLNQVFMNILGNAIDAIEESNQGRTFADIKAQPNRITIKTELSSDRQSVLIRFSDNGIGMTDEVKQKIFEHLFTTKAVGKGTGLGLAIARQIVEEKHQGSIAVNSTLGLGTEFAIALPIEALA